MDIIMALFKLFSNRDIVPCETCVIQASCNDKIGCTIYIKHMHAVYEKFEGQRQRQLLVGRCWTLISIGAILIGFTLIFTQAIL